MWECLFCCQDNEADAETCQFCERRRDAPDPYQESDLREPA